MGFAFGTKFEQYENLFFSPELDFSLEDLKTTDKASNNLKKQAGNYEDLYFNYALDYDLRNSPYKASSGNKTSFYQTLPIISGSPTTTCLSNLPGLNKAGSNTSGLLVAAIIITPSFVSNPSISTNN